MEMRKRTKEHWEQLFVQQKESGLSQVLFCEKFGVPYHGFRGAKGRYLKEKRLAGNLEQEIITRSTPNQAETYGFLTVEVVPDEAEQQGSCKPETAPEAKSPGSADHQELEVQLPFGVVLRFRGLKS